MRIWGSAVVALVLAAGAAGTGMAAGISVPDAVSDKDFLKAEPAWVEIGQLLFFDPVLSGNKNIACSTCHHPSLGTSDAMSLSMGEGGIGLGPERAVVQGNVPLGRIPRNAPALFNLGALEFSVMFHDGRVEEDASAPHGIRMPAGRELERPVPSVLAAQNILPILSPDEMSGHPGENEVADAVEAGRIQGEGGAWDILADRINQIDGYRTRFDAVIGDNDVHIADIAKALSNFINHEFRATDAVYDHFLAGSVLLPEDGQRGAELFYGKAGCSGCHSGPFLTDQEFHAIAMPQIGPGKSEGDGYFQDTGRFAVTGDAGDKYKFRTPSLRNIGLTAPYGHNGAYSTLESVVRHHLDPVGALQRYDIREAALHLDMTSTKNDWAALDDADELAAIAAASELAPVALTDAEVSDLVSFLMCLSDPASLEGRMGVPLAVPSGLSLD